MKWTAPKHTLGWALLEWMEDRLGFVATDEQARFIADWYAVYPHTGHFLYRRAVIEQAKGWGKSPLAAAIALAEFCGPVRFDHFDARGDPVGVPWKKPIVQIAAVSEDQAENTYGALYGMLSNNENRVAKALGIDNGRTRLLIPGDPEAGLYPVTASAGSREGQRVTFAVLDETHLWTPRNGGGKLARTIRRNAAKTTGRTIETTNAPVLGEQSVAEESGRNAEAGEPGILFFANRPSVNPEQEWTDEQLMAELTRVYGDAVWIDKARIIAEIRDPATPWSDAVRFYFNVRTSGAGRAVDPRVWDALQAPRDVPAGTYIGLGFDGSVSQDSTVLRACTQDGYRWTLGKWERPTGDAWVQWANAHPGEDWSVDRQAVRDAIALAFGRYRVGLMYADPWKWQTELADWQRDHGKDVVLALDTNVMARFAPAVDQWLTAIRQGKEHDGDEAIRQHVANAHLRKVRLADDDADGRTRYLLVKGDDGGKIDGAIADVLALAAAMTMPEAPKPSAPYYSSIDMHDEDDDE